MIGTDTEVSLASAPSALCSDDQREHEESHLARLPRRGTPFILSATATTAAVPSEDSQHEGHQRPLQRAGDRYKD